MGYIGVIVLLSIRGLPLCIDAVESSLQVKKIKLTPWSYYPFCLRIRLLSKCKTFTSVA